MISSSISVTETEYEYHYIPPTPTLIKSSIGDGPYIKFYSHSGGEEMLAILDDGFYVRGKKLEMDIQEAKTVYNTFTKWISWINLKRHYQDEDIH